MQPEQRVMPTQRDHGALRDGHASEDVTAVEAAEGSTIVEKRSNTTRDLLGWLASRSPLAVSVIAICIAFWPGHMSADTLAQIEQAAGAPITDHHAPVLIWLWSLVWPLGIGPGFVFALQTAAFVLGAYLVARAAFSPLGASLVAAGVALWPPVFGSLAVISRDVWFMDFTLLTFGLLAVAARTNAEGRNRALCGAAACAFLALGARQNAAAAVVVAAVVGAALVLAPRLEGRGRVTRAAAALAAGVAVTVGMMALQLGFQRGVLKVQRAHPEQYLYLYDLAAFSRHEDKNVFPGSVYQPADFAAIETGSSLDDITFLAFYGDASTKFPVSAEQVVDLQDRWLDQVTGDPRTYLDIRLDAWLRQIGVTRDPMWIYHPGIDQNSRGYETAFETPNRIARDYVELIAVDAQLNGGLLHWAWLYLVVAAATAFILLRRHGSLLVVGALAVAAWTYQLGLFFGTMGTGFRFEFPAVTIALLALAVTVGTTSFRETSTGARTPPRPRQPVTS